MARRDVHLMKPGSTAWVAGSTTTGTWCDRPVERDDVNHHALGEVTCRTCLARYRRAQEAAPEVADDDSPDS